MKELIQLIKAYLSQLSNQARQDKAVRVFNTATTEAERALQIREFQGALYLSYNDRPLLPLQEQAEDNTATWLCSITPEQSPAVETLRTARRTYRDYLIEKAKSK